MKVTWIHECDVIPQGFYIKRGALYRPEDYVESYGFKTGKDGLIEQQYYGYEPSALAKAMGPVIDWVTFGYNCRIFRADIRFVNRTKGQVIYKLFRWKL